MKREIEDLYIEIDSDIMKEANQLYLASLTISPAMVSDCDESNS
jgi:hypothetical protein